MGKIKRVTIYFNQEDIELLDEIDKYVKESLVINNRGHFFKTASRYFIKYALSFKKEL